MSSMPSLQLAEALAPKDKVILRPRPLFHASKCCFDFVFSGLLLLLLTPLYALLAVLIKLDSNGPVFFVQRVLGQNGSEFRQYKFRSMLPDSQSEDHVSYVERNVRRREPTSVDEKGPIFKTALADRGRITFVGRFLRRGSLDELPQLWNIFRGEMSFVGPRPALPYEAGLYEEWQKQRFLEKPGLTGLYQVTARNRVPIEDMIRIDLEYIRRQSVWLDLKIILRTPSAMLSGL